MKRYRAILLFVLAIIALAASWAVTYLNAIVVPVRIRNFISAEVERATGKKFYLQSLRFDLFKGLVLDGPVLYDNACIIIRAKEIDSGFLIPPVFKKKIIIPNIKIESPYILAERKADNSFNLLELIPRSYEPRGIMTLAVYSVTVRRGVVNFADMTLPSPFTRRIENADIDIRLALPDKIAFDLKCDIKSDPPVEIRSHGEYDIPRKETAFKIAVKDFSPKEFADYYAASGFSFPEGTLDLDVDMSVKDGIINADSEVLTKGLSVVKDNMSARLNSKVKAMVQYDTVKKALEYAGTLSIESMDINGVGSAGKLENIKANVEFNDSRVSSDNISVDVLGIPWRARINLINFAHPILDIYANASVRLGAVQKTLTDKFKIKFPTEIAGKSDIELAIQSVSGAPVKVNGYAHLHDATISMGGGNFPVERLNGTVRFTPNGLDWSDADFTYRGAAYKSSGAITNFVSPGVQLEIAGDGIWFNSIFAVTGKTIRLTELKGKYLNSPFSVTGEIDLEDPAAIEANVSGALEFELADLKSIYKKSGVILKMKPAGTLNVEFALNGDVKNLKGCDIDAKLTGAYASLYGLTFTDLAIDYTQGDGVGYLASVKSSFYGGSISAAGKFDWMSDGAPYSATFRVKDAKLEKYKIDTGLKDKDLAGDIKIYASVKGSLKDISTMTAVGNISIEKGRLWQLDLIHGIGSLIFTSDFNDIVFAEGSCDFKVMDKALSTDDLVLKSDLLNLYGSGTVDSDRRVNALLRPELTEGAMDPGFRKNIASAIGKCTVIEISGTLKDAKYSMRTSVPDIVDGVANAFLQQ